MIRCPQKSQNHLPSLVSSINEEETLHDSQVDKELLVANIVNILSNIKKTPPQNVN